MNVINDHGVRADPQNAMLVCHKTSDSERKVRPPATDKEHKKLNFLTETLGFKGKLSNALCAHACIHTHTHTLPAYTKLILIRHACRIASSDLHISLCGEHRRHDGLLHRPVMFAAVVERTDHLLSAHPTDSTAKAGSGCSSLSTAHSTKGREHRSWGLL